MQIKAKELAILLNGKIEGNPEVVINKTSKIEEGAPGSITFLAKLKKANSMLSSPFFSVID